ncbi:MAG: serine/threonine protein kinase [Polyangiaceae bacterium]|nr:serine/threonine protein kinase [Polyangiaceae bacterium]
MTKRGDSNPDLSDEMQTLRRNPGTQRVPEAHRATERVDVAGQPTQYAPSEREPHKPSEGDSGNSGKTVNVDDQSLTERAFQERYEARRTLGAGGMGEVKLCHDSLIGRDVAVKVMHSGFGTDSDARSRFLREARVQGQLEHPSVVPVYDLGRNAQGEPFFTMKRIKGLTMEEIIDGYRKGDSAVIDGYSRRQLLTALSRVCLAVAFAHSRGVVHRDLKPSNIMLGDYGEVNVLDWGVAKIRGAAEIVTPAGELHDVPGGTQAGTILGTPGFMAPEQARGEIDAIDERTDVYALGCILFELLALEPLHKGTTPQALLVNTVTGFQQPPSERSPHLSIPPELDEIVRKATQLEAHRRFESARAMHDAIERFLDGERDVERRKEQAQHHTLNAQLALAKATAGGPDAAAERARGMRELSTALALDPSHDGAMHTLMKVLLDPKIELPPEAEAELFEQNRRDRVQAANASSVAYAAWALMAPLMVLMGIRSWGLLVLMATTLTVQISISTWMGLTGNVMPKYMRWTMPTTFAAVASLSIIFGPLFLMPGAVAVNAAVMMVSIRANAITRRGIIMAASLALLIPTALMIFGVVPNPYVFEDGALKILPAVVNFPKEATLALLFFTSALQILSSGFLVGRATKALTEAERTIFAQAWRLRQLLPQDERPAASVG